MKTIMESRRSSGYTLKLFSGILLLCVIVLFVSAEEDEGYSGELEIWFCSEDALLSTQKVQRLSGNHKVSVKSKNPYWYAPAYWMSSKMETKFPTRVKALSCGSSSERILDSTRNLDEGDPYTTHFYPNGYFRDGFEIYAPDEYCITSISSPQSNPYQNEFSQLIVPVITLELCVPDCGVGRVRPCIKKCCPLNEISHMPFGRAFGKPFCITPPNGSLLFMPPIYHDYNTKAEGYSMENGRDISSSPEHDNGFSYGLRPHFILNNPGHFVNNCADKRILPQPSSDKSAELLNQYFRSLNLSELHSFVFRIRTDGEIMFTGLENRCKTVQSLANICVDGLQITVNDDLPRTFNNSEDEYIFVQCQDVEKDPSMEKYLSFTFGVLLLVTSIFPMMTCIVYMLLWKKQNVHGWTIAATSGCLFFMYIFHGSAHIIRITYGHAALNTFYCRILGVLIHFFMMSTFSWLTVMSCDLWLTFRSVTPMNTRLHGVSRYLKYSAFGWGIPTVIVLIGILMDIVIIYSSNDCSYYAVPAYGHNSCWIVEDALGVYLYYPAAFLLCVNIGFFTATCIKLCKYGRGPTIRTRKNDTSGEWFTKLFCVMGISWIFEILSWYVDGLGFHWYWNIFDVFNILRAVGVFVIYVCKKDIIMQLEAAYPSLRSCIHPFGSLFLRKCSEEMRTDTSVLTAIPGSPAIPLKEVNHHRAETDDAGKTTETLSIPK